MQIVVGPLSLKKPSFRTTWAPGIPASDDTGLHPPPPSPLEPSKHKILSSTQPSSASSSPPLTSTLSSMKTKSKSKNLESPSKESNLTYKNEHLPRRSMSLSSSQGRRTHATPDEFEFDLMRLSAVEQHEHDQGRFSKTDQAIIKNGKGKDDDGFKCSALFMCLPGFGNKAKAVKARKGETQMDHSVDPVMMSSTFSFENFAQGITNENNEDESISSYFELPSQMFKGCSGDGAQSSVTPAFLLDKDIKGDRL